MNNYGRIDKFIHSLLLNNKLVKDIFFELEVFLFSNKLPKIKNNQHLFISSLPRSGTTVLLETIYNSNEYASLTYSDMPLPLAPNLNKFLFNWLRKKRYKKIYRHHDDGIKFNLESPESFDEIFFKYINEEDLYTDLEKYLSLICHKYKKVKYLSKNNYNYKRISLIKSLLINSKFIIPFRDPLQQAFSLLEQHKRFTKMHKEDFFSRKYMNYLYHNEFGIDHIPWNTPILFNDCFGINYWLEQWFLFYQDILKFKFNDNVYFLCYEKFDEKSYLENFFKKNYISSGNIDHLKCKNKDLSIKYDEKIFLKCNHIYNILINI